MNDPLVPSAPTVGETLKGLRDVIACSGEYPVTLLSARREQRVAALQYAIDHLTWRPISEAPKDGTKILVLSADGPCVGYFDSYYAPGGNGCLYGDGLPWRENVSGEVIHKPTHWLPLPSPPQEPR